MSETPVKIVVDLSQPKGQRESIIPLTDDEIAERDAQAVQAAKDQAAADKVAAGIAAKKLSGRNKLLDLGLTEAEVTALLG
jgi:hypothetical protein